MSCRFVESMGLLANQTTSRVAIGAHLIVSTFSNLSLIGPLVGGNRREGEVFRSHGLGFRSKIRTVNH